MAPAERGPTEFIGNGYEGLGRRFFFLNVNINVNDCLKSRPLSYEAG